MHFPVSLVLKNNYRKIDLKPKVNLFSYPRMTSTSIRLLNVDNGHGEISLLSIWAERNGATYSLMPSCRAADHRVLVKKVFFFFFFCYFFLICRVLVKKFFVCFF